MAGTRKRTEARSGLAGHDAAVAAKWPGGSPVCVEGAADVSILGGEDGFPERNGTQRSRFVGTNQSEDHPKHRSCSVHVTRNTVRPALEVVIGARARRAVAGIRPGGTRGLLDPETLVVSTPLPVRIFVLHPQRRSAERYNGLTQMVREFLGTDSLSGRLFVSATNGATASTALLGRRRPPPSGTRAP